MKIELEFKAKAERILGCFAGILNTVMEVGWNNEGD